MRFRTGRRRGRAVLALLAGLLAGGWVGGGLVYVFHRTKFQEAAGHVADVALAPADELTLVPADAAGFVHVRAADLWRTEAMSEYRRVVGKAGDDALKALDDGFAPAPSTLDRVTVVALAKPKAPGGGPPPGIGLPPPVKGGAKGNLPPLPPLPVPDDRPDLEAAVVLAFTAPFDFAKVRQANLPKAVKGGVGDAEVWADDDAGVALAARGDKTLVVGPPAAVRNLLTRPKTPDGPLAPALKLAGGQRHVVAALNLKAYRPPPDVAKTVPPEAVAVFRADALTLGAVVGKGLRLDLRGSYKDEATAEQAEKELRKSAESGRKSLAEAKKKFQDMVRGKDGAPKPRPAGELPEAIGGLFALGAIGIVDDFLAADPVRRAGTEVSAEVTVESVGGAYAATAAASAALLVPAVTKVRDAAARAVDSNNLKQIGLALHSFHDVNGRLPPAGLRAPGANPRARPLLSWRVAILPFLGPGEAQLYQQFKLDEPWDSAANRPLLERMPRAFVAAGAAAPPGKTHYQVFVTPDAAQVHTMFGRTTGRGLATIPDGTSNTFMVVEAAEPVEWTRPQDIDYDPDAELPRLGLPGRPGFNALMGDGAVRFVPHATRPAVLHALIGADDGQVIPPE